MREGKCQPPMHGQRPSGGVSAGSQAGEKELSGDRLPTGNGVLVIHPVRHATLLMHWNGKTVYVDPAGGAC